MADLSTDALSVGAKDEKSKDEEFRDNITIIPLSDGLLKDTKNVGPLVAKLRSADPLNKEIRNWIADMLADEDGYLVLSASRKKEGRPSDTDKHFQMFLKFISFTKKGMKIGESISQVADLYNVSDTYVKRIIKDYR